VIDIASPFIRRTKPGLAGLAEGQGKRGPSTAEHATLFSSHSPVRCVSPPSQGWNKIREQGRARLTPNLSPSQEGNILMAKKHDRGIITTWMCCKSTLRF